MTLPILSNLKSLPTDIRLPSYDPGSVETGIVHLGLGAFHRAHQAVYTNDALEAYGGDWKIFAASMRDTNIPKLINAQNGLYTLITKSNHGTDIRVIASIEGAVCAAENPTLLLQKMTSLHTRIVSLTVTEKGYGIDRSTGEIDTNNNIIEHDLESPGRPKGVIGFIVAALRIRKQKKISPFTVLCCDNLPNNGKFLKSGVLSFARFVNPELANWIDENVSFPSTMVDRITPAQSTETLLTAQKSTLHSDLLAIETEAFHQWVIEDDFCNGRPQWEVGGALFTNDVEPFEEMKLRMLNGAHSMMAYAGLLSNHTYIRDVMGDLALENLVARHLHAAAMTLGNTPGVDLGEYASKLQERFANPEIAHETYQIASDGSQKLPQRIFEPAITALKNKQTIRPFAFTTALWMRYCRGALDDDTPYIIHDPLATEIERAINFAATPQQIYNQFKKLPGVFPSVLVENSDWNDQLLNILSDLLIDDCRTVIDREAKLICDTIPTVQIK